MYKLYLDDMRFPKSDGWTIVRSYDEFVYHIKLHGLPNEISFDHDLGKDDEIRNIATGMSKRQARALKKEIKSGYDCAKFLGEYCIENQLPLPLWNVHSANPVGKENIEMYLKNVERHLNL